MSAPDVEKGNMPAEALHGSPRDSTDRASERTLVSKGSWTPKGKIVDTARPFSEYMGQEVTSKNADILMLACYFCSGLTDSTVFSAYGIFVSMQTGNSIFLGLGASHLDARPYGWAESLISIACYAISCVIFFRCSKLVGPRKRGMLAASFFVQSALVFLAGALIRDDVISGTVPPTRTIDGDWAQLVPIVLLSLEAAGQYCASRALGISELPTMVITSLMYDLIADPDFFAGLTKNPRRNRRALGIVMELVGAIVGGCVAKATGRIQVGLCVVASIKAVIFVCFLCWRRRE